MAKPVKFSTAPRPRARTNGAFTKRRPDTSFNFGANVTKPKKKAAPAGGGS